MNKKKIHVYVPIKLLLAHLTGTSKKNLVNLGTKNGKKITKGEKEIKGE